MASDTLIKFAESLGCKLEERSALDSWVYDGNSIATLTHKYIDPDSENFILAEIPDHELLHEIAHWFVADECQRSLPEFGLAIGIAKPAYGPRGGEFLDIAGNIRHNIPNDIFHGLVDQKEQGIQEHCAQILEVIWGKKLGIPTYGEFQTWDNYLQYKNSEPIRHNKSDWFGHRLLAYHRLSDILTQ